MLDVRGCKGCFDKQRKIDRLEAKNERLGKTVQRLLKQSGKEQRKLTEGAFGSSTPPSQIPIKPNSTAERQQKRGGAKPGHPGHGRKPPAPDEEHSLPPHDCCPDCGGELYTVNQRSRTVVDAEPLRVKTRRYRFAHQCCRACGHHHDAPVPGVMPKAMLSNHLQAVIAAEHYFQGLPMGQLVRRTGLNEGTLYQSMHQLAGHLETCAETVRVDFRQAPVKHADETTWRIDGANGYCWYFGNPQTSLFDFADTRAARVVSEMLGQAPLPGCLVTDRYAAYNISPCQRQFCYAHLLRQLQDLGKERPAHPEVQAFVGTLAPLLAEAMGLRGQAIDDPTYYREAKRLRVAIEAAINHSARDFGIRNYQSIFRENRAHMYHWVHDRRIPPDNNFAERNLRPTVIVRKQSFGSQSAKGARTRGIIMTVLHTLAKRGEDPIARLTAALDLLATQPHANLAEFLFPAPPPINDA